jgi:hypothetical protein
MGVARYAYVGVYAAMARYGNVVALCILGSLRRLGCLPNFGTLGSFGRLH